MKKKLEAELISIAHRILKLKNRDELDVLQQETLKLYEKISVLRFVEDNFNDVKPTIGYASAEETLEEIYGIEETPVVHANEQEAKEEEKKAKAKSDKEKEAKADEAKATSQKPKEEEEPQATSQEAEEKTDNAQPETKEPVDGDADPEQPVEEYQASEEEKEHTEEETDEDVEDVEAGEPQDESKAESLKSKEEEPQPETTNEEQQTEISAQPEIEKSDDDVKAMEEGAAAVYKKEDDSTLEEEEQAADAEVITIAPDDKAKVEDFKVNFEFAFERTPAPEEPQKQKEITFEDYHNYKEPEFVKKGDEAKEPQAEEEKPQATSQEPKEETRDWRDWEPAKEEPKAEEPKAEQPQAASIQSQSQPEASTRNPQPATGSTRSLNLGLNDRIAFEKNLFGGSGEDLNRVVSQLNTFDSFDEAKEFIADMVKPDYNNWLGKEEYEERFMALVEKKFD